MYCVFKEKSFSFSPLFFLLSLFFSFTACTQSDDAALLERGKNSLIKLLDELKGIHRREHALEKQLRLEARFEEVAQAALALKDKGLVLETVYAKEGDSSSLQRAIYLEIERIYQIDGCQEIIEKAEDKALQLLDRFEHERDVKLRKKENQL